MFTPETFCALRPSFYFYLIFILVYIQGPFFGSWTHSSVDFLLYKGTLHPTILGMAMFSDPQYSIEHRQAMPLLRKDLVQAVPSQVAVVYWNAAPLASHDPTTRTRGEGAGSPPPMLDVFLDPSNQELPSFNPGSLSPMLHAQLYPEGPAYSQRTGFGYRDQSSCTTHQELVPSPQITDPNLLVNDSRTTPTIPGTTVQWSSTTHIRISPAPTPDLPADFLTEYAEDVWRFLRKWGNRYECLRDGASGSLCGYSGSLTGIKRHLRSSHHLERFAFSY